MIFICAGLIGSIDLCAAAACFRLGQAGVNTELLNRVRVRKHTDLPINRFIIVDTVQSKIIVSRAQAIGVDR